MPRLAALPLTLLVLTVAAVPARAATTVGDTTTMPMVPANPGAVYVVTADGSGHPYAVPAGGGVITSVAVRAENSSSSAPPGTVRVLALRGSGMAFTVIGGGALTLAAGSDLQTVSAPARVPVAAGDRLGAYSADNAVIGAFSDAGAATGYTTATTAPADGGTVTLSGGSFSSGALSVSATVEPDADHDGYGDETQDSCPTIASIHTGVCATDLRTSIGASPSIVAFDDVSTVVATVADAGTQTATGATATLTISPGLQVVAASTTGGECSGTTCALGDIPAGQSRKVYVVVRGVGTGAQAVGVTAHSAVPEADTSNDGASAAVTVAPAPSAQPAAGPATPGPASVKLCTVPSLKGRTAAAARSALQKAGCAGGTAKGSRSKTAKVSSQVIPARVKVLAGTKVGYTLKVVGKKAEKKR